MLSFCAPAFADDAASWLAREAPLAKAQLVAAATRPDAAPGAVIASPSRSNPDYYFHWVRDAAIAMDVILDLYRKGSSAERRTYRELLINYARFSRGNQKTPTLGGMGEPKFYVDGHAYDLPWGRPQNDGPALRAIALSRFATALLDEGDDQTVLRELYSAASPADSVIKADLEFVSHHWRESSFDLWEEVQGQHFFTRMAQRRALLVGAVLARRLGDPGAADWYEKQASQLSAEIQRHRDSGRGLILNTLDRVGGLGTKSSNLDAGVILGSLRGDSGDGFFSVLDSQVVATLAALTQSFQELYPINHGSWAPGTAIGRYPEDKYSGGSAQEGNPWVLTTLAFAEAYYRMTRALVELPSLEWTDGLQKLVAQLHSPNLAKFKLEAGTRLKHGDPALLTVARALHDEGDALVLRVRTHAHPDGSLNEQIDRNTGYMTSAADLTWNYAQLLSTLNAR
jgi:glucoamylase